MKPFDVAQRSTQGEWDNLEGHQHCILLSADLSEAKCYHHHAFVPERLSLMPPTLLEAIEASEV